MSVARGRFITFEGLDGSGKTTQMRRLTTWLESQGHQVVTTREPGGTPLGNQIRSILLDSRTEDTVGKIAPRAEMALMFADRAQDLAEVILPALDAGKIVLCDRWTDSSEAYQGAGRGLGPETVLETHHAICGTVWPELTILLLPDLASSLARARRRNDRHKRVAGTDENRFEKESDNFYSRIHAQYLTIAAREPQRVALIPSNGSIEEVEQQVRAQVQQRLGL